MRVLYFDCFSGASGDMLLGALLDAGVPLAGLRAALGSLAIAPETVWTERVTRTGISATKFCVRGEDGAAPRGHEPAPAHTHAGQSDDRHGHHSHEHGQSGAQNHGRDLQAAHDHPHRTLADIAHLIDRSALSPSGKDRATALFRRLGEAEAAIHGIAVEEVHLHEVGALDSIIDIVGVVHALESLGVDRIVSSPLNVGSGTIVAAHGRYPVPAPATLRLLQDAPVYAGGQKAELVTPTGALLVTSYATEFGPLPALRVRQVGYGAGARDFADTPNVLRVVLGDADDAAPAGRVSVLDAEIDDMNPQIFGVVMDRLLAEGALDVYYTPVQMKKNRPGTLLTVIAPIEARERLSSIIFQETTTIGIRHRESARECLDRETVPVQTPFGTIRIKVARRAGAILNAAPEFDDCVRAAREHGRPVKDIQARAARAFFDRAEGT